MQLGGFFVLSIAGIAAGFIYEIGVVARSVLKNKIWSTVLIDFVVAILMGGTFIFVEIKYLNFQIFGFGVASYIFGILLERISFGFLLAKLLSRIYNKVRKLADGAKNTKLGKRVLR